MNAEQLNNVIAKAQKLMLDEEFNRKVESKANQFSGRRNVGGGDMSMFEQQAFNKQPRQQVYETKQPTTQKIMPAFMDGAQGSVIKDITSNLVNEQLTTTQQPQVQYSNSGIDYSLIKSLIDESINRHLEQIKGNLNEGSIKGLKIGKGNVIQFADSKGNIYEGVLKLKKKAQS